MCAVWVSTEPLRPRIVTIVPGVEELIGDEDRLIDDAARIVAQIEDQRAERVLAAQLGERGRDVGAGRLDEAA